MKKLFFIRDESASQVVSLHFVAQSTIEAIRQFKGFIEQSNYPAHPKELALYFACNVTDNGSLYDLREDTVNTSDNSDSFIYFKPNYVCNGLEIDSVYFEHSVLSKEDIDKMTVSKNVTEADFDEEQKNGDFGK